MHEQEQLPPEEGFLLYLLQFAIDEWGPQNVSLSFPTTWNGLSQAPPRDIQCDYTTESVVTLAIACGRHHIQYHTLVDGDSPGFFSQEWNLNLFAFDVSCLGYR